MAITKVTNSVVSSGSATDGYVLTADGSGNSAWEEVAGGPTFKTFGTSSIMIGDTDTGTIDAANYNTGLGVGVFNALTSGDENVMVGFAAGQTLTTGSHNIGIGVNAVDDVSTGSFNVGIGTHAVGSTTTASNNTGVGYSALFANTTGTQNTAVGQLALQSNTTASYNTAVGRNAGGAITTGSYNICIGRNAGDSGTTMHTNICIGKSAGNAITSGDRNIILGENVNPANGNDYRSININTQGATGKGGSTGFISAGAASGMYQGNNTTTWSTTSDRRIKKNIVDNTDGLNKITNIQVKNFEYRTKEEIEELGDECAIEKEGVQLGVIAQELQTILPDCVKEESTGCLTVNADNITWYLVNAVKELSAKVEELESQLGE
jgi:trimeric autotransporter adhesin